MRMVWIPSLRSGGERSFTLEPWRKIVADGFDAARKPDAYGVWLQDLQAATRFRDQYRRERKVPLTYTPMLVKACALALRKYPLFNSLIAQGKFITPPSIDVGISVTGEEVLAPVVVIKEADAKSLKEIVTELREKRRWAGEQQRADLERLNRVGRCIPWMLRKKLVARVLRSPAFRRRYVGTFQISILERPMEFFFTTFLSTTAFLTVGSVMKRPVVVEDRLEIRPTVYLSLAIDHRVVAGKHTLAFMREIERLLLNPEELGD